MEKMSARMFSLLFVIFLVFCQGSSKTGDKDNPFRVKKLNMIWQKAQNKMSERKLSDFRRLLENQDRAEIRWKELKASGGDEDGEMEATLRRKFSRVLEQFGLEEHLNSVSEDGNKIKDNRAGHGSYSDKRLDELWESVQNQGTFSPEELNDLETEFNHHREKLKEYKHLMDVLKGHDDISENSVFSEGKMKKYDIEKIQDKLQSTHETLTKNFERLKEKVTGEKVEKIFRDPRVNELWERAKDGGLSEDELESFKDELHHFDHKILKHKHFQEEVEDSQHLLKNGDPNLKDKHDTLVKKAKEHGRWVKKMHSTLMDRVTKNEL